MCVCVCMSFQELLDEIASRQHILDEILKRCSQLSHDFSPTEKSQFQIAVHNLQKDHRSVHTTAVQQQQLLEAEQTNRDNFVEKLKQVSFIFAEHT